MNIEIKEIKDFSEFIKKCEDKKLRLVKMKLKSFIEPDKIGGDAFGLVGKDSLLITALIPESSSNGDNKEIILRYLEIGRTLTIDNKSALIRQKAYALKILLEKKGIMVVEGEWKKDELKELPQL